MAHYAGLDVSKITTTICVVDPMGISVEEGTVTTDPRSVVRFLRGKRRRYGFVGLEAGAISTWLHGELVRARLPAVLLETRRAHKMLSMRANKTDLNDARGIAELLRTGSFRAVHAKSVEGQRLKSLLTVRKLLIQKQVDIEFCIKGVLIQYGRKLAKDRRSRSYGEAVRQLVKRDAELASIIEPLLAARTVLGDQVELLTRRATQLAADDPVCRRLMTAPAIGPLTALEFRAAIDDPARFAKSRNVAAHLGLTPRSFQSGEEDWRGRISRRGDTAARVALFVAGRNILCHMKRPSHIRTWGLALAEKHGLSRATVAVARRLAVTLHAMWKTETDFRWTDAGESELA